MIVPRPASLLVLDIVDRSLQKLTLTLSLLLSDIVLSQLDAWLVISEMVCEFSGQNLLICQNSALLDIVCHEAELPTLFHQRQSVNMLHNGSIQSQSLGKYG